MIKRPITGSSLHNIHDKTVLFLIDIKKKKNIFNWNIDRNISTLFKVQFYRVVLKWKKMLWKKWDFNVWKYTFKWESTHLKLMELSLKPKRPKTFIKGELSYKFQELSFKRKNTPYLSDGLSSMSLVWLHREHCLLHTSHTNLVLSSTSISHHPRDRYTARLSVTHVVWLVRDDCSLGGRHILLKHESIIVSLYTEMILGFFLQRQ